MSTNAAPATPREAKKPLYKRKWAWVAAGAVVLAGWAGGATGGDPAPLAAPASTPSAQPATEPSTAPASKAPEPAFACSDYLTAAGDFAVSNELDPTPVFVDTAGAKVHAVFVPATVRDGKHYVDKIPADTAAALAAYADSGKPAATMDCSVSDKTATYAFESDSGGGRRVDLVSGHTLG
jgi:hypothetical protein